MFCPTCGAANQLGVSCGKCSASLVGDGTPVMYGMMPKTSGLAIAGFILAFFCGLLGLIFSAMALSEIKKSNGALTGEGFAIAGLVLSLATMVGGLMIYGSRM